MSASAQQLAQLQEVNATVNASKYDATLQPGEGNNVWKDKPDGGDWVCRDYVLMKAEQLQALGWPQLALSCIECWTEPEGDPPAPEHHAVLAVEAAGEGRVETWILDERVAEIYRLENPPYPYRWERRQEPGTLNLVPFAAWRSPFAGSA